MRPRAPMAHDKTWPRAILLDFYGTVVEEDDRAIADICEQVARALGGRVAAREVESHWGRTFFDMCFTSHGSDFKCQRELAAASLRDTLLHFESKLDPAQLIAAQWLHWTQPALFFESADVLAKCNMPICVVSNIDSDDLRAALEHTGLSFDLIVTSEDCRAYKPRREPFERALSLLGLSPSEVFHVGDSLKSDVRGAKAQGIPVLWVNRKKRGLPAGGDQPEYVASDLTGLLRVVAETRTR